MGACSSANGSSTRSRLRSRQLRREEPASCSSKARRESVSPGSSPRHGCSPRNAAYACALRAAGSWSATSRSVSCDSCSSRSSLRTASAHGCSRARRVPRRQYSGITTTCEAERAAWRGHVRGAARPLLADRQPLLRARAVARGGRSPLVRQRLVAVSRLPGAAARGSSRRARGEPALFRARGRSGHPSRADQRAARTGAHAQAPHGGGGHRGRARPLGRGRGDRFRRSLPGPRPMATLFFSTSC